MIHPPSRAEMALLAGCAAVVAVALVAPPLMQVAQYHQFADARAWLGVSNAANVLSNLPFLLFGAWGVLLVRRAHAALHLVERAGVAVFFAGLLLTAVGSGIYHWQPDDATLALDRLAMAVAFAGLLALAAAERVSARAGAWLGAALIVLAPAGVWVWHASGNLLPWALVQGGGMGLLVALALRRPRPGALVVQWGWVVGVYAVAKVLEFADQPLFDLSGGLLSGHCAKHLVAAAAALPVIFALRCHIRAAHDRAACANAPT